MAEEEKDMQATAQEEQATQNTEQHDDVKDASVAGGKDSVIESKKEDSDADTKEKFAKATDEAQEAVSQLADNAKDTASKVADDAKEKATKAAGDVKNFASKTAENAKDKYGDSASKAKEKFFAVVDRRRHTLGENLRLIIAALAIAFICCMFCPLASVTADVRVEVDNPILEKVLDVVGVDEEIAIVDNEKIIELNYGDMVLQKQLKDYEICGVKLGDLSLFGINLYDVATSPMPDFSGLIAVNEALQGDWVKFLSNPEFLSFVSSTFGQEVGDTVAQVGKVVTEIVNQAGAGLTQVIAILTDLSIVVASINEIIAAIQVPISAANIFFLMMVLAMILAVVLIFVQKGKRKFPVVLLTIDSAILLLLGIIFVVGNIIVGGIMGSLTEGVNTGIRQVLTNQFPDIVNAVQTVIPLDSIAIIFGVHIVIMIGWYLITLFMVAMTVLAYVVRHKENKNAVKQVTTGASAVQAAAVAEQTKAANPSS